MTSHLSRLHQFIVERYDLEELRTLCFDLGVNYDDLRGEALSGKARELILKMGRQRQLDRLLVAVGQTHPDLSDYPELSTDPAALEALYTTLPSFEDTTLPAPPAPGESPFKGLQYFDQADAHLFFGREALTVKLVDRLRKGRFLAVVGASGSGKSSVVRAGLIPALQRGASASLANGADWPVHVITPTSHPLEVLAASLTRDSESVTATATLMDDLARDPRSLHLCVRRILSRSPSPGVEEDRGGDRLLLVVDQFEELFTLCRGEAERQAFVGNLLTAVADEMDGPTMLVIALRADFYGHCAQYEELRETLARRQEYIGPMNPEELRRAIEEPATRNGWEFEPGLVDLLLRDVSEEPGALPLLSHALLETWRRRRGRTLTLEGYHEAGGVQGAIAKTAEAVFQRQLTSEQQAIARNIFLRLTELGEGTQDTRRRARLAELLPAEGGATDVEAAVRELADARLLITGKDERGDEIVDVAHEALIRGWPRLRAWIDEDRAALRTHRRLTEAAEEWERDHRDESYLYRGARLAGAEEWAEDHADDLNELERAFLTASVDLREKKEAEREAIRQRELETAHRLAETERSRAESQAKAATILRWLVAVLTLIVIALVAVGGPRVYQWVLRARARGPLVHIPASQAVIGSDSDWATNDEKPVWTVEVPAFDIERYEVTNHQYRLCVKAGVCTEPGDVSLYERADRSDHPVVMVNAYQAAIYCRWVGRRLLTELEWERAARGPEGRSWPWGEDPLDPTLLNVDFPEGATGDTRPVGSYPKGATPEGILDLMGNVSEWTATDYQSSSSYPYRPDAAVWDGKLGNAPVQLVLRGGGWRSTQVRSTGRNPTVPSFQEKDIGFRCARSSR